jgi:hypothetical protein
MTEQKTATLTARVPIDIKKHFEAMAKAQNTNVSSIIRDLAVNQCPVDMKTPFGKGGGITSIQMAQKGLPEDLKGALAGMGGLVSGALVYWAVDSIPDKYMKKQMKDFLKWTLAITTGIIVTGKLVQAMSKMKK